MICGDIIRYLLGCQGNVHNRLGLEQFLGKEADGLDSGELSGCGFYLVPKDRDAAGTAAGFVLRIVKRESRDAVGYSGALERDAGERKLGCYSARFFCGRELAP